MYILVIVQFLVVLTDVCHRSAPCCSLSVVFGIITVGGGEKNSLKLLPPACSRQMSSSHPMQSSLAGASELFLKVYLNQRTKLVHRSLQVLRCDSCISFLYSDQVHFL